MVKEKNSSRSGKIQGFYFESGKIDFFEEKPGKIEII